MVNLLFLAFIVLVLYLIKWRKETILAIGMLLLVFGLFAIYSVSIHESFTLTLKLINSGHWKWDPSNYFYFFRQIRNVVIALVMGVIAYKFPLKLLQNQKYIFWIAILFFLLQLMVFIPGVGTVFNGARGWIKIGNLTTIQPAEFFKLAYVIFLSSWLIKKKQFMRRPEIMVSFVVVNVILLFIFLLIPDLWTVVVLALVGLIMFWYAGAKVKHVILLFIWGLVSALLLGALAGMVSDKFDYIQRRFTYFLSSDIDPQSTDIGWQNHQALVAIGGGGFFGQGYGKGLQKFGYIPEAQSDFIFSAFSEEIGFMGNMVLLALYFYLAWFVLTRLYRVRDPYLKLIGVGIISLIIVQMFVNLWVNLKIMPNTGLTLPFVSFGGTALMVNMIEIVLLYKIVGQVESRRRPRL